MTDWADEKAREIVDVPKPPTCGCEGADRPVVYVGCYRCLCNKIAVALREGPVTKEVKGTAVNKHFATGNRTENGIQWDFDIEDFNSPAEWGVALSELARQLANAHFDAFGVDPQKTLSHMASIFVSDCISPFTSNRPS